mmetsp:Transcript_34444/g.70345  ORF Transcript_34444/g.70345 Transcript_34444/m.70345 type:complete len:82 (+) Transcript_34444:1601-1846(+)
MCTGPHNSGQPALRSTSPPLSVSRVSLLAVIWVPGKSFLEEGMRSIAFYSGDWFPSQICGLAGPPGNESAVVRQYPGSVSP